MKTARTIATILLLFCTTLVSAQDPQIFYTNVPDVTIIIDYQDTGSGVGDIQFQVGEVELPKIHYQVNNGLTIQAEGDNVCTLTVWDKAGNPAVKPFIIHLDTTAPFEVTPMRVVF